MLTPMHIPREQKQKSRNTMVIGVKGKAVTFLPSKLKFAKHYLEQKEIATDSTLKFSQLPNKFPLCTNQHYSHGPSKSFRNEKDGSPCASHSSGALSLAGLNTGTTDGDSNSYYNTLIICGQSYRNLTSHGSHLLLPGERNRKKKFVVVPVARKCSSASDIFSDTSDTISNDNGNSLVLQDLGLPNIPKIDTICEPTSMTRNENESCQMRVQGYAETRELGEIENELFQRSETKSAITTFKEAQVELYLLNQYEHERRKGKTRSVSPNKQWNLLRFITPSPAKKAIRSRDAGNVKSAAKPPNGGTNPTPRPRSSQDVMSSENGDDDSDRQRCENLEQSSQHFRLSGQLAPKREIRRQEEEDVSLVPDLAYSEGDQEEGDKEGEETIEDGKMSPSQNLTLSRTKTNINVGGLERLLNGPLAQNNPELLFRQSRARMKGKGHVDPSDSSDKENDMTESFLSSRSKTMPTLGRPKLPTQKMSAMSDGERLRNAKEIVEKAVKYKKIFTIQGGYSTIRNCLRRRGWVEKFYKIGTPPKKTPRSKKRKSSDDDDNNNDDDDDDDDDDYDDDDDDDDNDQPKIPPWEEDDGIYGIMSRMVRNVNPSLFWVLKRDAIDYRFLNKDQMVNHYCKAGSFTTKVGLCVNMKNVAWFDNTDYDSFFPRCYRLSHDEDKMAFIDDYRLTACMSIVKIALDQQGGGQGLQEIYEEKVCTNPECTRSRPGSKEGNKCVCSKEGDANPKIEINDAEMKSEAGDSVETMVQPKPMPGKQKKKKKVKIPGRVLETAVYQCEKFLASKEHDDIDVPKDVGELTDQQWDDLIQWYYQLVHEEGKFSQLSITLLSQCESLSVRLAQRWPQYEMDGTKNVWIVKPGAKSRGRGIICYDKLEDMLKLVSSQVVKKDGKYVVQKYMERPLLVYNTKFDIRQWFLVTDWNPLTLYFYKDSYLRFCSQQFTLDDFDQSIHLSNNAIQKHYKNGPRSSCLPDENMWTHEEFKDYLTTRNQPDAWDEIIYPSMKRAIICALLVTQDLVEYRKSSFELYGADFMLTEDLKPWLIEINSGPSMESSTAVTSKLCTAVLDDTLKVVVDRRFDKNCDIGAFELAFKQPVVTVPPYIGINLCVEGQPIRRPQNLQPRASIAPTSEALFTPRSVAMRQTHADRSPVKNSNSQGHFGGSNSAGPNLEHATVTTSHNHHFTSRRENRASTPEAVSSSKSLVGRHQPREVNAKINSFRSAPGHSEKVKLSTKGTSGNADQSESGDAAAARNPGGAGVPAGPGGATVNGATAGGSIISLPRTCAMCGRGGNLHLSAADPNCRCQQDSVLVTLFHNGGNVNETDNSQNVHKNQANCKQRKSKMSQQRKATSVTPTRLGIVSVTDGGEPHSPTTEPDAEKDYAPIKSARPLSASTVDQCLVPSPYRPNVHHRKLLRKSAMASMSSSSAHPPDSVFNPQQNLFHTQQSVPGPSKRQSFISPWQALATSSHVPSSVQELIYSPLHPLFNQTQRQILVQPPSYRPLRVGNQNGFRGRMYAGGKIAGIGGGNLREYHLNHRHGAPTVSSLKLWTNMGLAERNEEWISPLSVVAQRRARLKHPK